MDKYSVYGRTQALRESADLATLIDWRRRHFRQNILRRISLEKNARILDLGCGYGVYLDQLRRLNYLHTEGIDISEDQVRYARKIFGLHDVTCADAVTYLERKENTYDCILAIDILEHLPYEELISLTKHIVRSLKPGGRLVVQAPNGYSFMNHIAYSDLTHVRAFTPHSLEQLFLLCGFTNPPSFFEAMAPTDNVVGIAKMLVWTIAIKPIFSFYSIVAAGNSVRRIFSHNFIAVVQK